MMEPLSLVTIHNRFLEFWFRLLSNKRMYTGRKFLVYLYDGTVNSNWNA